MGPATDGYGTFASLEHYFPRESHFPNLRENFVMGTILVIVLILVLIGVIPTWPHSSGWGYGPSGIVGTVLIILLILVLLGRI